MMLVPHSVLKPTPYCIDGDEKAIKNQVLKRGQDTYKVKI
jgi:hypothetical protein